VQLEPPGSEFPQVLVSSNCPFSGPDNVIAAMGIAVLPALATVTNCGALSVFFATLPNAKTVGDTV
jgi:hypothetical protein